MNKYLLIAVVLASLGISTAFAADSSSYGASNVTTQAATGGGMIQGYAGRVAAFANKTCSATSTNGRPVTYAIDSVGNLKVSAPGYVTDSPGNLLTTGTTGPSTGNYTVSTTGITKNGACSGMGCAGITTATAVAPSFCGW